MLHIRVSQEGDGDFRTITDAVQSVPYEMAAQIDIGPGIYEEKLFCEKRDIALVGSGASSTVLRWADGAYHRHADGTACGTFRSYTAFLGGDRVRLSRLRVENAAGDGETHGQSMAVYADARRVLMDEVELVSCQDTLFCAPLPERERQPRGFYGPRALTPRLLSRQYYDRCRIQGDIDFIFGGADAVFEDCELVSNNRGRPVNGYVTAPSGEPGGLGFVFLDCRFTGDCPAGTVYLGRPWRPRGKATLLNCALEAHIHPAGWAAWEGGEIEREASFSEYGSTGPGAHPEERALWARRLTQEQALDWRQRARALREELNGEG